MWIPPAHRDRLSVVHRRPRLFHRAAAARTLRLSRRAARDRRHPARPALLPAPGRVRRLRRARRQGCRRRSRAFRDFSDGYQITQCARRGSAAARRRRRRDAGAAPNDAVATHRRRRGALAHRGCACTRGARRAASAPRTWCSSTSSREHAPAIGVFTLDTGRLPEETHALIDRVRDRYGIAIDVYLPDAARVESFVRTHGVNAFYDSVELRKTCCAIRKTEPLRRALAGKGAWITGLRREQSVTRSDLRTRNSTPCTASPSSIRSSTGARTTSGPTSAHARCPTTRCTIAAIAASAARPAREPSSRARTCARDAGGGKTPSTRNAGCTAVRPCPSSCARRRRDSLRKLNLATCQ